MNATVTLNGVSQEVNFIALHARANTGSDQPKDYAMRKYDVEVLKDSLDTYYPQEKIMVLGDFNDDVDETVANGVIPAITSYISYKDDAASYSFLSKELSENGYRSTISYPNMIDHIMASNEIEASYIKGSAKVHYEFYDGDYEYTASDHFPVSVRLQAEILSMASVETTAVVCAETATATATANVKGGIAPYTYLWSDGQETQTATGLTAGDYSVKITDELGNSVSSEITIETIAPISITMIDDKNINIGYLQEAVILEPETVYWWNR